MPLPALFPIFTYVNLSNQMCLSSSGDFGVCLSSSAECRQRGGFSTTPCAAGYGACCIVRATCGMTVRENITYFVQMGYPRAYNGIGSCQVTLIKPNLNICQYRLDFDLFNTTGPESTNHLCNDDQFIVVGSSPIPTICGINTGNHMYINAGNGISNPITLSIVTSGSSFSRSWKIRISQIPCNAQYKADDNCLQYHTGVSGQMKSFNYGVTDGRQLSNQDYSICIRAERNFCSIQYTQCFDSAHLRNVSFTLTGDSRDVVPSMVGSNFCRSDFLVVPLASNIGRTTTEQSSTIDRICGGILAADVTRIPSTIRSNVRPFRLYFHTDSVEAPLDIGNRGFCINYVQQPCGNSFS
ncbi:uncharacterized protein LOC108737362 [Agrilus planipennis]|uniref:Uncharacterized protein LOC108737362 n=1 Tax=Agrilus planipennis TaxID=224129 RepID=A0A1W4WYU0_AGRPL|nr:uncharacterized protein LOC108737362 [Agrilus planipennis]